MTIQKLFLSLILCLVTVQNTIFPMEFGSGSQDPLSRLNYRTAFDQNALYQKFAPLMERWGCAHNVLDQNAPIDRTNQPEDTVIIFDTENSDTAEHELIPLIRSPETQKASTNNTPLKNLEENYTKACLAKLQSARRWALSEDARIAGSAIALQASAVLALKTATPNEVANGFGMFALFYDTAMLLRPALRSIWNLTKPPTHPLNGLEERFAINQCFIPKKLWPIITNKFMIARTNQFEQRNAMDFLEFSLGLTSCKQKPALTINEQNLRQGIQTLFNKIDHFFADYKDQPSENLWMLKDNVSKFILSLTNDHTQTPRYLYLQGLGGIGKTYFINQLSRWIEELIPDGVCFENVTVSGAEELEGSSQRPGAILRVLRNQLLKNKRGSIVFMDEASWLNKEDMISSAKRVFNGDQSTLTTSYFGSGVEGTGVALAIPPILTCLASNDQIKDPALKTRFDTIEFPAPKKETLIRYAREIAAQNDLLKDKTCKLAAFDFNAWIEKANVHNFRDVAAQIVPAILSTQ